ncbi:MAG: FAD-dependent monooxygenase [Actinomycetota bacterium]
MRIVSIGGGPAGLYASLLLKKLDPRNEVTVVERNAADATYGWGVVFSDQTLTEFREADFPTYRRITDRFVQWDAIDIVFGSELVRSGGHVFAGIARKELLGILRRRCEELGVDVRFGERLDDFDSLPPHDLLIGADGVASVVRRFHEKEFRPSFEEGGARYIWYGTNRPLDSFTFIFRESEHGLFQVHAYPFDGTTSTWIVEASEETWRRAGLDEAGEEESIAFCERLFADDLRGNALLSNNSRWLTFTTLRCRLWRHANVVLVGDAAHTAHFSIGSGTKLAMEDSISLARAFEHHGDDVEAALADYELERKPVVERFQEAAAESRTYFENTARYLHLSPQQFAFHLLTRSGRIDYDVLRIRDPEYADRVDRWFAGAAGARTMLAASPPTFTPISLRGLRLPNRIVVSPAPRYAAEEGQLGPEHEKDLARTGKSGAALVLTEVLAVSPDARITPGDAGLYQDEHEGRWAAIVEQVHRSGSRIGLRLGHAGRRGSTRHRREGLDRPLRHGGWDLVSASAIPYRQDGPVPRELDRDEMDGILDAFVSAAGRAARAGFDLLELSMAHGYLLGSFLSPLTNVRTDEFGGSAVGRMRFPVDLFRALRKTWPQDRPLAAAINATDWATGGTDVEDAVMVARALAEAGCDLVEILAGHTTPDHRPRYGRLFLVALADRVRNETPVRTLVGGGITATGQANTVLAGARADLILMIPPV